MADAHTRPALAITSVHEAESRVCTRASRSARIARTPPTRVVLLCSSTCRESATSLQRDGRSHIAHWVGLMYRDYVFRATKSPGKFPGTVIVGRPWVHAWKRNDSFAFPTFFSSRRDSRTPVYVPPVLEFSFDKEGNGFWLLCFLIFVGLRGKSLQFCWAIGATEFELYSAFLAV